MTAKSINKSNLNCVNKFGSFLQASILWLMLALLSPWQILHLLRKGNVLSFGDSVSLLLPKTSSQVIKVPVK